MAIDLQHIDFKGVWIPKDIWMDTNLSLLEKCIYVEIDSLDNSEGCYATNAYLAEFCQCSERKVSDAISRLEEYGLLSVENVGRQRLIHTEGSKNCEGRKNCEAGSQKVLGRVEKISMQGSKNCDQNNKDNYKRLIKKSSTNPRLIPPTLEEVKAYCLERGNNVDPQRWYDYYTANGWKVGRNPMKDWKASVRYWEPKKSKSSDIDFEAMAKEVARELEL